MDKEKLISFFREVMKLKKLKRSGWVVSGIENPESVADHSFMTTLLVLFLGKNKNIDLDKALKMAILHDIAESRVGDIITWNSFQKTEEEKRKMESEAMKDLLSNLGPEADEYFELWKECDDEKTPEARFVRQVDKVEMVLQALEYEINERDFNDYLYTFYDEETTRPVSDEDLLELIKIIKSLSPSHR